MWYRIAAAAKLLSNPIVGGFWVNEEKKNEAGEIVKTPREIKEGEELSIRGWFKLLSTRENNVLTQEKLNDFLNNSDFSNVDGKKTYIPKTRTLYLKNPIIGGLLVDDLFIDYGQPLMSTEWAKLLKTDQKNTNSQEKLNNFLNDSDINIVDGQNIYSYRDKRIKLYKNPIVNGFYVGNEFIEFGKSYNFREWARLLTTAFKNVNSQEKLNHFLETARFEMIDDKYTYLPFDRKIVFLSNPVPGGFWVGKRFVEYKEKLGITEWARLLTTADKNVNNEESLRDFLSDPRRFDTFNNKKTYIPVKRSIREGLFVKKFNRYNHDNITVKAGQYIIVMTNKTNILYLDFAFIKNKKILLAVEINGYQHYGFVSFGKKTSYDEWQDGLRRDILKINYCHNNKIPLLIFNHMLSIDEFRTIVDNLHKNPHAYDNFIPQPVIDNNPKNTSIEFVKRQIYSHLYPVFNGTITFKDDEAKKRYIKDTLILISKLMGIYEGGIDKTDYIKAFDTNMDLTSNYNKCLAIYNLLYPDFPLDKDEKITYSDLSIKPRIQREKSPEKQKQKENLSPILEKDIR